MTTMERAVAAGTRLLLDDIVSVSHAMQDGTVTRAEGEAECIAIATAWLRVLRDAYGHPGICLAVRNLHVIAVALQERAS